MEQGKWLDVPSLIASYERTLAGLKQQKLQKTSQDPDYKIFGEMISDCEYVLEWLETGRRPGNRRGIERRAGYQREKLMDPAQMQVFVSPVGLEETSRVTNSDRELLQEALALLSGREEECYTLAHGYGYSLAEIAEMLGLSKSSVALYVRRAQQKITVWIQGLGQQQHQ